MVEKEGSVCGYLLSFRKTSVFSIILLLSFRSEQLFLSFSIKYDMYLQYVLFLFVTAVRLLRFNAPGAKYYLQFRSIIVSYRIVSGFFFATRNIPAALNRR